MHACCFFLILYSSSVCSQNWQWAGSSGVGGTSGLSLTKDLNGGIIVLASTENPLKTEEIIVNKYNNAGSLIWATSLSGTSGYRNSINDLVARETDVFSTGCFCSQTTFGSFMLNCAQSGFYSTDAFVSKVVDTPPLSTGVFKEYSNTIQIVPNPNTGDFNIKFHNTINKSVEVSDLTGRIILSLESDKDLLNVSLKDSANGVYFVKIVSNNTSEIIKVVKQ